MNKVLQWSIASTVVILLCMASYSYADIPAARWFHLFEHTRLYELFGLITLLGDSIVYLFGGILLFILFRHKNRYRTYIGLFLFTAVATSGLTADLVKCIAGRARPVLCFNENLYGFAFFQTEKVWTSFPSGHSATALSVAMLLATLYPRWRVVSIFTGFLVAFSRIFLAQHFISDVIAGSFLGIATTALLYTCFFKTKFESLNHGISQ